MAYCTSTNKECWKEGCKCFASHENIWRYNFEREETKMHCEQSYLSRTIWCYLLSGADFSKESLGEINDIFIGDAQTRYLFDVMNNSKNKSHEYRNLYHTIGNFTPVPVLQPSQKRKRANTIQLIHNWCGEGRWDKVLSCMSQGIYKTKRGNEIPIRADGFNFESYMKNTYQHFYYSKIFDELYKEYKDCSETKWQKYIDSLHERIEKWNEDINSKNMSLLVLDEKEEEYEKKVCFLIEARGRCIVAMLKKCLNNLPKERN